MPLIFICLAAGTAAFGQATFNGQFNDRHPLFQPSPIVGTNPAPLTNWGKTNIFTGTNRFLTNTAPVFSNQVERGFIDAKDAPTNSFGPQRWTTNLAGQLVPVGPSAQFPQLPRFGPGTFPAPDTLPPTQPVPPVPPSQPVPPTQPVPPSQPFPPIEPLPPVPTNQPVPPAVPGIQPVLPGQQPPPPDVTPPPTAPPNTPPKILLPATPPRVPGK